MSHYDVLGVSRNASPDDIRHAYLAKVQQFHPDRYGHAPQDVQEAVNKALVAINDAGRVLQDPKLRADYDRTLKGSPPPVVHYPAANAGGLNSAESIPALQMFGVLPVDEALSALETLIHWRSPTNDPRNQVKVPDVRGMKASAIYSVIGLADLHVNVVHLTENPAAVDGTVVDQDPPPETSVRRFSTVTVQVWHPAATDSADATP